MVDGFSTGKNPSGAAARPSGSHRTIGKQDVSSIPANHPAANSICKSLHYPKSISRSYGIADLLSWLGRSRTITTRDRTVRIDLLWGSLARHRLVPGSAGLPRLSDRSNSDYYPADRTIRSS